MELGLAAAAGRGVHRCLLGLAQGPWLERLGAGWAAGWPRTGKERMRGPCFGPHGHAGWGVGTESGLRSGLLAASVTLSMAATCGLQNCGDAGYEAGRGCYLWTIWF